MGSLLIRPSFQGTAVKPKESCSPAECKEIVATVTCLESGASHCGFNKLKDMSCNHTDGEMFQTKCPPAPPPSPHTSLHLTPLCFDSVISKDSENDRSHWMKREILFSLPRSGHSASMSLHACSSHSGHQ